MRHLKAADQERTVIMVQVENETGTYGAVRDYSPLAEQAFAAPVPSVLLKSLHKTAGNWRQVFGAEADEYFHAWSIARFVEQVAAAGKAEYPLPMYVNAALRDPLKYQDPFTYSSGGPTWNVLDIWKAAAPSIDAIGPDIYEPGYDTYLAHLGHYVRPDNPRVRARDGQRVALRALLLRGARARTRSVFRPLASTTPPIPTIRWAPPGSMST